MTNIRKHLTSSKNTITSMVQIQKKNKEVTFKYSVALTVITIMFLTKVWTLQYAEIFFIKKKTLTVIN